MGIGEEKAQKINGNSIYLDPPQWDDLTGSLFAARLDTASGRLDYDPFNAAVKIQANARYPEEPMVIPQQARHAMVYGSEAVARPHFHWLQEQSAIPNFLLAWKLTNYNTVVLKETDFSNHTFAIWNSHAFTYPGSGVFAQITKFPEIDLSSMTISASIDFVLFRDSGNVSGLFAGADPVAANVLVKYNDPHVKFDSSGSRQEFVK